MTTLIKGQNTKKRVTDALKASGYDVTLSAACFMEMNKSGKEVHSIKYPGEEGEAGEGLVYLWEREGILVGDF